MFADKRRQTATEQGQSKGADLEGKGSEELAVSQPPRRVVSELQKLQAYLDGVAEPEVAAEVSAKLDDPNSLLSRGLSEVCGPRRDGLSHPDLSSIVEDLVEGCLSDEAGPAEGHEESPPPRRVVSELQKLQAYLDGVAEPEVAAEVAAKLDDPNSLLRGGRGEMRGPRKDDPQTGS